MKPKWIYWGNLAISFLTALFLILASALWLMRPVDFPLNTNFQKKYLLPKGSFTIAQSAYDAICEPFLTLKFSGAVLLLPDIKQHMVYFGRNGRPDNNITHPLMHFSFNGSRIIASTAPREKVYLTYDKNQTGSKYTFSEENKETSLWFEAEPQNNEAVVRLFMKDEKGEIVTEPLAYAEFKVQEKEFARIGITTWELGPWRVDGSLLARQRARWVGCDCFLERHGGEEFSNALGKHRIDFGEAEDVYSVFINIGDCMIWENEKWNVVQPGEHSLGKPMLIVKKLDERLMNLELWDTEGKGKLNLNLVRSSDAPLSQKIEQSFHFVGARTKSQCVFEINNNRMFLSPEDWLVFFEGEWRKLATPEEIDDYVNRKIIGPLFVFDGITRKDDHQVMLGTLYNASRTEAENIELAVHHGTPTKENNPIPQIPQKPEGSAPKMPVAGLNTYQELYE